MSRFAPIVMESDNLRLDFGVCPKCGEDEPVVRYKPDASSFTCGSRCPRAEHFNLECRRCQYKWPSPQRERVLPDPTKT